MTTLTSLPSHARSRLSIASDALLLIADLQKGIADLPLTVGPTDLGRGVEALLDVAAAFELPLVITAAGGADGPAELMPELEARRHGVASLVRTTTNSFNDDEIRRAIEASGRRILLIAGVATEIAVQLPSLAAAAEGYEVHVVVDACGGLSARTEAAAHARLSAAGVHLTSTPTLAAELARDFADPATRRALRALNMMKAPASAPLPRSAA